jgi:hypothetical protein
MDGRCDRGEIFSERGEEADPWLGEEEAHGEMVHRTCVVYILKLIHFITAAC